MENRLIYKEGFPGEVPQFSEKDVSTADKPEITLKAIKEGAVDGFHASLGKIGVSVDNPDAKTAGTFLTEGILKKPEALSSGLINVYGIDPQRQSAFLDQIRFAFDVNNFIKPQARLSLDAFDKRLNIQPGVGVTFDGVPSVGAKLTLDLGDKRSLLVGGGALLNGENKYGKDINKYSGIGTLTFFPKSVGIDSLNITSIFVKEGDFLNITGKASVEVKGVTAQVLGSLEKNSAWNNGEESQKEIKRIGTNIGSHGISGSVNYGVIAEGGTLKQDFSATVNFDLEKVFLGESKDKGNQLAKLDGKI